MNEGAIIDAYLSGETLVVRGPANRILHVPTQAITALRGLSRETLRSFEIDPDGSFLHWPEPDVHLGWSQLLQAVDPKALHKARQRSADFSNRYGAAIRRVREQAGLAQSAIDGLTDRQLRRIESGECRATSAALASLATAHGVEVERYMEMLAQAMAWEDGLKKP